jgi:hypothetical protein
VPQADSSSLAAPRLLARLNVDPDELDDRIAFCQRALGVAWDSRMPIPEAGLELATVGNLLLIGNPNPPGEVPRATAFTLLVASVADYLGGLEGTGAAAMEPISTSPAGNRSRVRSPTERWRRSSTTDRSPRRPDRTSGRGRPSIGRFSVQETAEPAESGRERRLNHFSSSTAPR